MASYHSGSIGRLSPTFLTAGSYLPLLRCRFATPDEIEPLARLVAHSFPGPARPASWWLDQLRSPVYGGGAETLFIGELAGRVVAVCQLHPLRQWVSGEALAVTGVGTVSISPTQRRRRLGSELMEAALNAAHERGDVAAALYPFRTSFYENLGFGRAGHALQYQIAADTLPDSEERFRVELLDDDASRGEALDVYGAWARGQTGQLLRSERVWAGLCTAPDRALAGYRAADGRLAGYALVTYRTDLPRRDRFLEVEELVWTSPGARRGLYGWLSSLGDQWEHLLLRALPSHQLGEWTSEPRLPHGAAPLWGLWEPAATLLMGPMFRIIDMRGAWTQRRVAADAALAVSLDVHDAQLPANSGVWHLELDGGAVHIRNAGEANGGAAGTAVLRLGISALSRLFIGALSPTAGVDAGLIECDRPDVLTRLDAALALPEPWTFDRF